MSVSGRLITAELAGSALLRLIRTLYFTGLESARDSVFDRPARPAPSLAVHTARNIHGDNREAFGDLLSAPAVCLVKRQAWGHGYGVECHVAGGGRLGGRPRRRAIGCSVTGGFGSAAVRRRPRSISLASLERRAE